MTSNPNPQPSTLNDQPSTPMEITLITLDGFCKQYADAYQELTTEVQELTQQLEDLKRARMNRLKRLVAKAADARSSLAVQITHGSHLFIKPRTCVIRGIKIGYEKGKGRVEIDDEEKTLALIKKHYDESHAELLIRKTESPNKKALGELPANDLKKLGVTLTAVADQIIIKPVDGDVEKLVTALLKDASEPTPESQ